MSDPLAEIIAMLNLRAVLTSPALGSGVVILWRRAGRRLSAGN